MDANRNREKIFLVVGITLIAFGALLNQWTAGYFFRPEGMYRPISGISNLLVIWSFQAFAVLAGLSLILKKGKNFTVEKLSLYFRKFSVFAFSLVVIFVALNVFIYAVGIIQLSLAGRTNPVSQKYDISLADVYPGLSDAEIRELLTETWQRPFLYESYTQFKEREFSGKYVNVDAAGFRYVKNQEPWPSGGDKTTIFVFGGSTAFGYGVQDEATIASYVQEFLRESGKNVAVYNFARGHYYSTQERVLYEKLLSQGFVPDAAIFIDGINDFRMPEDEPKFTSAIAPLFNSQTPLRFFYDLPLMRFVKSFGAGDEDGDGTVTAEENTDKAAELVRRYLSNKRLIEAVSEDFGVTPVFVWQPAPTYKYGAEYNLFHNPNFEGSIMALGYPYMAGYIESNDLGKNFLYLADIQEDIKKPLYVDAVHYSGELSREIAGHISDFLENRP